MIPRIQLDESSTTPLYRQLYEQIAAAIRYGGLANGTRLPATRELASQFGLNRTTVSAAYALLESEGLIRGHVGRGSFVKYEGKIAVPETEPGRISFASSRPAAEEFPLLDFQRCCSEVATGQDAGAILQLGSPAGYAPLRRHLIAEARTEGSFREGDDLLITNGCQQALDLLQRVFAPAGTTVVVEDPVYHGLKNVFQRAGARLVGIRLDAGGLDIAGLSRVLVNEKPVLLILTPDFQNPTGLTLSLEARQQIVSLVREFGITLVENAIYGDLRYQGDRLPTLRQIDDTGSTILIRSFSKI